MDALYSSGDARILCWQSHSLNHQCSEPLTSCFHCAALSRPIALVQVGSSRPHSLSFFLPFSQVASSFSLSLARLPRNSGPEFNNERRAIIIIISPPPFKIGGAAVQWSLLVSPVSRNDSSLVKNRAGRRVVWKRSPSSSRKRWRCAGRPRGGRTSLLSERLFSAGDIQALPSSYGIQKRKPNPALVNILSRSGWSGIEW